MSSIVVAGDTSGTVTLQAPAVAGTTTLNLPAITGTVSVGSGTVTAGGVVYTDGTKEANTGAGTSGQYLKSNGASAPTWASLSVSGTLLNIQYFTTPGTATYTPTTGTNFVIVEVIGGGGGGGGISWSTASNTSGAAGGGSGGGYARKKITSSFSGVTITVGSAGTAGSGGANGGTGGTSSFGALVSATGGTGGVGTTLNTIITSSVATGVGSSGDINLNGGANYQSFGGSSFYSQFISPSAWQTTGTHAGVSNVYGGGGSAGFYNAATGPLSATGGAGGAGIVIVYEYA